MKTGNFFQKIRDFFDVSGAVARAKIAKLEVPQKIQRDPGRMMRLMIAMAFTCLVFGFLIGSYLAKKKIAEGPGEEGLFGGRPLAADDGGNLILADFESVETLARWEFESARMELTPEHASGGSQSAKVTFEGNVPSSGISIEDFFSTHKKIGDWTPFNFLRFYVFNPNLDSERLILQIKDQWHRIYKEDIFIPSGQGKTVEVNIPALSQAINIRKIEQVLVFRWEPKDSKVFYFDDFRLFKAPAAKKLPYQVPVQAGSHQVHPLDYGFRFKKKAWSLPDAQGNMETVRVPFVVTNETNALCRLCPVEGGIPFPMGEVKSPSNLRLMTPRFEEIPFQPRVLARWPDQSLKWVGMHYEATFAPHQSAGFYLEYGPAVQPVDVRGDLTVHEEGDTLSINTGKMGVQLNKKSFYLFEKVFLDQNANGHFEASEQILSQAPLVLKFQGKEFRADLDHKTYKLEVEEKGEHRAVIKASGWFQAADGSRYCQAIVRYYFYQGKTEVRVAHTLIYTGYPENRYFEGYKSLQLPANETIQAFGLRLPFKFTDPKAIRVELGKAEEPLEFTPYEKLELLQLKWDDTRITDKAFFTAPEDFFTGWMDASDGKLGLTVGVRNFRENFPKAMGLDPETGEMFVDLWPEKAGELNLATTAEAVGPDDVARGNAFGLGKTHEMLFYFHPGDAGAAQSFNHAEGFMKRLLLRNNPYWIQATGALGKLYPADKRYAGEEKMLERQFDWAARHPKNFKWYGMLDFGDTLTWYRAKDDTQTYLKAGWNPVGRWGWYNCEGVGTHTGALLQFARTGAWKYFEFGENLARHIMDVDTIHYDTIAQDPRLKHLDHINSQVGGMHRHSANHWSGMASDSSHTNVWGLLLYHYLTGDERARDVALEVGEYFLGEPFQEAGHPEIVPHRAMGNALLGDVVLYDLKQDERFKQAADKIIDIYLAGQQEDGSFLENYNPLNKTWSGEKHYMYMQDYALGAFIAYHQLTQDDQTKDMLLKLVKFLAGAEYSPPITLHGFAYAYALTKDVYYLSVAEKALQFIRAHQPLSRDPMLDGLIYDKPIYHRPMEFLSTVPYVFDALEEGFEQEMQ